MVRTYKSKTERSSLDEERIKTAVSEITLKVLSITKVAEKDGIKPATLQHRVEKFRIASKENQSSSFNLYGSKYTVAQVFTAEKEKLFSEYLLACSKMHFGFSLQQFSTLAYEYAEYLGCRFGIQDNGNRNQELSPRKPENTSAARSFAFNKTAVAKFSLIILSV
ncbi:hypothetical protein WA026_012868 [Henosepilachna vigintioctopunctata]|uniref:HTH psq-type domain-containing protein n=1 Tax=Henosepilachna vigintioctopunctata TaxID=420089 RepID=A0AAW1TK27_9CUCU